MTNTDTTPKPAGEGNTTPGLTPEENGKPEQIDPSEKANSEAAKYRTRLRATEAERDTLAGRLEQAHRTMIEGIAGRSLAKPEALWAAGTKLADLLDEDGNVDGEKVAEAAKSAQEALGLERVRNGPIIPDQGKEPERAKGMSPTFANAFSPR